MHVLWAYDDYFWDDDVTANGRIDVNTRQLFLPTRVFKGRILPAVLMIDGKT